MAAGSRGRGRALAAICLLAALGLVAGLAGVSARTASARPERLPAAGELLVPSVLVRVAPDPSARVERALRQFRPDGQFQIVLALTARRSPSGILWYELSLPGRPNGQRGWVAATAVDLHPVPNRIVVHVAARTLEVLRISDRRLLLRAVVAVGKPGAETPLGHDFYVQERFTPDDPFYGPFVLETSAYSRLSDWPGGGLAGIHGTDRPDLLGKAVSHGCVRVANVVARALERLAPLGTPIDILR